MGGTLTLWPGKNLASQYAPLAGLERKLDSSLVFCTLLGPEGPAGIRLDAVTASGPLLLR